MLVTGMERRQRVGIGFVRGFDWSDAARRSELVFPGRHSAVWEHRVCPAREHRVCPAATVDREDSSRDARRTDVSLGFIIFIVIKQDAFLGDRDGRPATPLASWCALVGRVQLVSLDLFNNTYPLLALHLVLIVICNLLLFFAVD